MVVYGQLDSWADGRSSINVVCHQGDAESPALPGQTWPVCNGHFKALVILEPETNVISFRPQQTAFNSYGQAPFSSLDVVVHYVPLLRTPPLHLAIMVGNDSPLLMDAPRSKTRGEPEHHVSLAAAVFKLRVAAYLWQALTAQCAYADGIGRRSFRLDEARMDTSLSRQPTRRDCIVPIVHVVRSNLTTAQLRNPDYAQQNPRGRDTGRLFGLFMDALTAYGGPFSVSGGDAAEITVAGLIFDAHYDPSRDLIVAHAALGGNGGPHGKLHLGMFGSHLCWSWPRSLEEVPETLLDDTVPTHGEVGNDAGDCGTAWEAAAIGLGAMLHEVGHSFGCPHQPSGIMLRGYVDFPRSFLNCTAYCSRTRQPGLKLVTPQTPNENVWHLNDLLIFRSHPAFWLPSDTDLPRDAALLSECLQDGVHLRCPAGIAAVRWEVDGRTVRADRYGISGAPATPFHLHFRPSDLEALATRSTRLGLFSVALNGKRADIPNVWAAMDASMVALPGGTVLQKRVYRDHFDDENTRVHVWTTLLVDTRDRQGTRGRHLDSSAGRLTHPIGRPPKKLGRRNGAWLDCLWLERYGGHREDSAPARRSDGSRHSPGGSSYEVTLAPSDRLLALHVVTGGPYGILDVEYETSGHRNVGGRQSHRLGETI